MYNYGHSTRLLASSTLRNVLGTKDLRELLADRESIARIMQQILDKVTSAWGVVIERVEMLALSITKIETFPSKKN